MTIESVFGDTALATPANAITVARLLVTPLFLAAVVAWPPSYGLVLFWFLLSITDGVDGWLARRQGTTRSGAFLDPLADKFSVIGALVALVVVGRFWWLPVTVIAVRELAITGYRSWQGRRGVSIPARWWAKVKTVVQQFAVAFALFPPTAADHPVVAEGFLWSAVVLTAVTGVQYLLDGRKAALGAL